MTPELPDASALERTEIELSVVELWFLLAATLNSVHIHRTRAQVEFAMRVKRKLDRAMVAEGWAAKNEAEPNRLYLRNQKAEAYIWRLARKTPQEMQAEAEEEPVH